MLNYKGNLWIRKNYVLGNKVRTEQKYVDTISIIFGDNGWNFIIVSIL